MDLKKKDQTDDNFIKLKIFDKEYSIEYDDQVSYEKAMKLANYVLTKIEKVKLDYSGQKNIFLPAIVILHMAKDLIDERDNYKSIIESLEKELDFDIVKKNKKSK